MKCRMHIQAYAIGVVAVMALPIASLRAASPIDVPATDNESFEQNPDYQPKKSSKAALIPGEKPAGTGLFSNEDLNAPPPEAKSANTAPALKVTPAPAAKVAPIPRPVAMPAPTVTKVTPSVQPPVSIPPTVTVPTTKALSAKPLVQKPISPPPTPPPVTVAVPDSNILPPTDVTANTPSELPKSLPAQATEPLTQVNEFGGAPAVPGSRRLLARGEAPEDYVVEPGDTLSDICDQLIGERDYWPKLWAMNPAIKNPHFVYPGMHLRFNPGDDNVVPSLQVLSEADVVPVESGGLKASELIRDDLAANTEADALPIPEASPFLDANVQMSEYGKERSWGGVSVQGKYFEAMDTLLTVPGYLFTDQVLPVGMVIGGLRGEVLVGMGETVMIEPQDGQFSSQMVTILRPDGELISLDTRELVGYRYQYVAQVRIDSKTANGALLGKVSESRLGIRPSDIAVSYLASQRSIPAGNAVGTISPSQATVVGFEYGEASGGEGGFVYLDRGAKDGIGQGQFLEIFQGNGAYLIPFGTNADSTHIESAGIVRIIDATDHGAVGYIVRSNREIRLGDRTGR